MMEQRNYKKGITKLLPTLCFLLSKKSYQLIILILLFITILSCDSTNKPKADGDFSWERINVPLHSIYKIVVSSNGDIWAVTYEYEAPRLYAVYLSTDNGDTWVEKVIFQFTSVEAIAINPVNGYIFVGLFSNELFRSTDRGESWVKVLDNTGVIRAILIAASGEIYMGTIRNLYYSTDNGNTWVVKNHGLIYITSLALGQDGTLYAGSGAVGVYRSTDGGDTWLPPSNYTDARIHRLTISNDGSIFAAAPGAGVLKSIDKGVTWNPVNTGIEVDFVYRVIYNPITMEIFISDGAYNSKVYRSTNLGASWKLVNSGISNDDLISDFAFNPNTGQMYVATDNGVYRSSYR